MSRKILQHSFPVVAVMVMAFAASGRAQNDKPAEPVAAPTVASLLAGDFAYVQPQKDKLVYRVNVDWKGEAIVMMLSETTAGWKYGDGGPVTYAGFFGNVTPWYGKDVKPPAALLAKMAADNDSSIFVHFSICTNAQTGEWTVYANAHQFLRGATKETFANYVYLAADTIASGKKAYAPFMQE